MNKQPSGEIILYQRGDAPAIDVRLDGDTVWLSQQQLADLFQTSRTNVVEHIANIYAEGELSQEATCRSAAMWRPRTPARWWTLPSSMPS